MALQPSGPMGLYDIRTEIRGAADTTQIGLLDSDVRNLAGQPSGDVEMPTDFYGKSVIPAAAYSVSTAPNPVDEGNNVYIQVSTLNYYVNYQTYTIYWRMIGGIGSSITNSDLGGGYQLNTFYEMTLNGSGIGTVAVPITADESVDTAGDSFYVQLSRDQTSIVYTSAVIDINDTSTAPPPPAPTYSIVLSPSSINEGSAVSGTITTTNFTGDIFWRIVHVSSSDTDFGNSAVTSGVNNTHTNYSMSTSQIGFIPLQDQTTEGDETFYVVLSLTAGGTAVATSNTVTILDTSQTPSIIYNLTTPKTRVSEGDTVTFTITTTNYGSGTLYWRIPANLTNSQFSGITANTFYPVTVTNNSGTIQVTIIVDTTVETGYDNFIVYLYDTPNGNILASGPLMEVVDVKITGPSTGSINVPFNVVFSNGVPGTTFTWVQMWVSEPRPVYGPNTFDANGNNTIGVLFQPGNAAPFTYTYRFTFAGNSNQLDYSVYITP